MADVEEPKMTTLAERIAALNQQKNFQSPVSTGKRPPPPPPPARPNPRAVNGQLSPAPTTEPDVPSLPQRSPTVPSRPSPRDKGTVPPALPRRTTTQSIEESRTTLAPPPLPSRQSSQTSVVSQSTSPALPARRPSAQSVNNGVLRRKNSNESDLSTISGLSLGHTISNGTDSSQAARKMAPAFGTTELPKLPPTKREREAKEQEAAAAATAEAAANRRSPVPSYNNKTSIASPPPRPSFPPRLPSRPARTQAVAEPVEESTPKMPPRRLPPPPASFVRPNGVVPVSQRNNNSNNSCPNLNHQDDGPPPVPLASRPTDQQIDAATSRLVAAAIASDTANCLVCRDFSAPDAVAAQHPLSSLPRYDVAGHLARVLCSQFSSLTDKARAIFTWCHHNIDYDVEAFFSGNLAHGLTTDQAILSGKGVCEGYARNFEAIATRAGLQCVVVGGHGKGYGFAPVKEGEPCPPKDATGHAWNAVLIDGGRWKLLDACWGAGNVGNRRYNRHFSPHEFTASNEVFGDRHFPTDPRHFYREDGRVPSWEEYVLGPSRGVEPADWCGPADEELLSRSAFTPQGKHIRVRGGDKTVRFQFPKACAHLPMEKDVKGRRRIMFLEVHGLDGREKDYVPMSIDRKSHSWWIDVPALELGAPGQKVAIFAFDAPPPGQAGWPTKRQKDDYMRGVWSSSTGICVWELV